MARWFRFYEDAIDDPKAQLLDPPLFKNWVNLLCLASRHAGVLPTKKEIAFALHRTVQQTEIILTQLMAKGLIDKREDGRLEPHNWSERQYKSDVSTGRVQQFRKRFGNVSRNGNETPPEYRVQSTDTENRIKKEESKKERTRASALVSPKEFEMFWNLYPHKVGKEAARKSFEKKVRKKIGFPQLMAALQRYRDKTDDRPWCNPATWLNQERWDDVPAPPVVPQNRDPQKQGLNDALAKLREYNQSHTDSRDAGGKLYESARLGPGDFPRGVGEIVECLPRHRMDTGPDQWDSGEVSVLPYARRHQG
jgi:hypothetical protein